MAGAARVLLAANWKMNPLSAAEAAGLARRVLPAARRHAELVETALFPPFPWLLSVAETLEGSGLGLGAQDCHWERSGAHTGEVSAAMLQGWCGWVIAGHSERRTGLGETDEMVARKTAAALRERLQVIVCVGEPEAEFAAGRTAQFVGGQLRRSLEAIQPDAASHLVVAYEPIWAIGTGRSADTEHAYRTMRLVRTVVGEMLGDPAAGLIRVLYGGSVNSENVASYVELPLCDGCLVGGASLKAEEFSAMIESVAGVYGAGSG